MSQSNLSSGFKQLGQSPQYTFLVKCVSMRAAVLKGQNTTEGKWRDFTITLFQLPKEARRERPSAELSAAGALPVPGENAAGWCEHLAAQLLPLSVGCVCTLASGTYRQWVLGQQCPSSKIISMK